jgi:hydroxyacylglutathione hydrolase
MEALADGLTLHTIQTPSLGDRSYLAIHDGWAVAVDVQRDLDRVEDLLREHDAQLGAVLETHIHNDYLTGGLVLARRLGAEYVVPQGPRLGYSATRVGDGSAVRIGSLTVRAIDAPGHTDAHAAYSLHVEDAAAQVAFTGGSLLLGATGRTDLLGIEFAESLARRQYWTARRLARILHGDVRLRPTHGFGSFCAAGSVVPSGDTLAEQLDANPAYLLSEEEFVADLLARLGDYPSYYAFMGPRNAGGVTSAELPVVPREDLAVLRDIDGFDELVVDVRARERWARAHLPGSLSVDARGAVATWLGWLRPIDAPVRLIAESEDQIDQVVRDLHRIGFDRITAAHVAPSLAAIGACSGATMATFGDLAARVRSGADPLVVDTRETSEWRTGHVRGAFHVPAHEIDATFDGAPPREQLWLYCGVGMRATIAASLLLRLGVEATVIDDTVGRAADRGVPWCDGSACSDQMCTSEITEPVKSLVP